MIADMGLPPSPCSLFGNSLFKRFSPLHASRALQELVGRNDPKLNMKMAESLLTISAHNFREKWNFDPIAMKPTKGKYIWTPLKPDNAPSENSSFLNRPICSRLNQTNTEVKESHPKVSSEAVKEDRLNTSDIVNSIHTSSVGHESNLYLPSRPQESKLEIRKTRRTYQKSTKRILSRQMKPTISKTRQCKITEFGRQRKRLNSTSISDPELDVSPRKKISLDSPLRG